MGGDLLAGLCGFHTQTNEYILFITSVSCPPLFVCVSVSSGEHKAHFFQSVSFCWLRLFLIFVLRQWVGHTVKRLLLCLLWEVKHNPEIARGVLFWKLNRFSVQFLCLTNPNHKRCPEWPHRGPGHDTAHTTWPDVSGELHHGSVIS